MDVRPLIALLMFFSRLMMQNGSGMPMENNCIISGKWEATHDQINCCLEEHCLLQAHVVDLESLLGLQQTTLQSCQDKIAGLEETVAQLVMLVKKLEKMVC